MNKQLSSLYEKMVWLIRYIKILFKKDFRRHKLNKRRVRLLFATVKLSVADDSYLCTLEKKARKKRAGWKESLDVYVQALAHSNSITIAKKKLIDDLVDKCDDFSLTRYIVFLPIIPVISLITLFCLLASPNDYRLLVILIILACVSCIAINKSPGYLNKTKSDKVFKHTFAAFIAIIIACISLFIPAFTSYMVVKESSKSYKEYIDSVEKSDDYKIVHEFAKVYYDLDLYLDNGSSAWIATHLAIPDGSVAFASIGPGYCALKRDYDSGILKRFPANKNIAKSQWLQGVMAHELGHCVDISQDYPSFRDKHVHTHSVPPKLRRYVKDLDSFMKIHDFPSTLLWHEAYADIFAVGFWRISYPNDWEMLAQSLKNRRLKGKDGSSHATACWIDSAVKSPAPQSKSQIGDWATNIRLSAHCDLPSDQKELEEYKMI